MTDESIPTLTAERGPRPTALELERIGLVVDKGPSRGARVQLQSERMRIGRGEPNDLALDDDKASRVHAEVSVGRGGIRVVDLGSHNGTFLGDHRIVEAFIVPGDELRIGHSIISVEPATGLLSLPLARDDAFGGLLGRSVAMRRAIEQLSQFASTDATVLVTGETGTGKEEAARALHAASPRAMGPFVVVDCSSIPAALIGSELFGHDKGAFTGATDVRLGAFERADGGTVFLDELGDLPLELQPNLLRLLERKEVRRLGSSRTRTVDVRIVAATNRDLRRDVNAGRFRTDLFFRLAVVEVVLPPLRERPDDIPLLVDHMFTEVAARYGVSASRRPTAEEIAPLMKHYWPGNVRELRNAVERSVIMGAGLDVPDVIPVSRDEGPAVGALSSRPFREAKGEAIDRFERAYLTDLLASTQGNVSRAARKARMDRSHLIDLVKRYGLGD